MKKVLIVLVLIATSLVYPTNADASSGKDKALSLAASGCSMGWLDSPLLINLNNIGMQIIMTASSSQWNDATNNYYVQIHHTQISESWNLAASLDSKWSKLSNTYSDVYDYIGEEAAAGTLIGEIWNTADRKYGPVINANCKIAIMTARAKAKAAGKSFPKWIIATAGSYLPPLDPRTKI
jgi:hypothetical protein